ncbi:glycoside hydrolase family 5 protein [Astrocystis sublimbata]|nr:glycoside hydrolase family 5 protein [Astrocystis sublimbata]
MAGTGKYQWLLSRLTVISLLCGLSLSTEIIGPRASWPNGPFVTSERWITDAAGAKITYVGVNWPAASETMLPEGLQYQSVKTIVSKIKSLGMNSIRLTYAIEMIDQYYDNGEKDVPIQKAFADALGQENGKAIYDKVIANNPSFDTKTTRLQVFEAVAAECAKQEIYVHLDNHISKAGWCCTPTDGNSWFGDKYFDVKNWTRGLSFMATQGKTWPNLMSMSLRNELRVPLSNQELLNSYNWEDWYENVKKGADAIHSANSDVLIFLSGLDSDKDLSAVIQGTALEPGTSTFNRDDFQGYGDNKLVLELHIYDNILGTPSSNCSVTTGDIFDTGFETLTDSAVNQFPLVVTEFGFPQNATTNKDPYASCLLDYFPEQHAGWMLWSLGGSYYIREGSQDVDEEWGLLSHDWSSWRSPRFVQELLRPAVKESTAPISDDDGTPAEGANGDSSPEDSSVASKLYSSHLGMDSILGVFGVILLSVAFGRR